MENKISNKNVILQRNITKINIRTTGLSAEFSDRIFCKKQTLTDNYR